MELTSSLCKLTENMQVKFTFNGKPISNEEVFADTGLLPALAKRADQLCSLCLGYGIGASFTEAEGTVLGSKVQFDEATPNVLRLALFYDVLLEMVEYAATKEAVPLDELMYE